MERFTQHTPNGASLILGEPKTQAEAAEILKEQFKKACNRLCELEDKLESGQIVDTTPYIEEFKSEIPFKYKVIKPTVHRRNVEMCQTRELAEKRIAKLMNSEVLLKEEDSEVQQAPADFIEKVIALERKQRSNTQGLGIGTHIVHFKAVIEKNVAAEIYDLCCRHGTTYIKNYLKEKYGVGADK